MAPKTKGKTIDFRELQRIAYESGNMRNHLLPSQSSGIEKTNNRVTLNKYNDRYQNSQDNIPDIELNSDWRKNRTYNNNEQTDSKVDELSSTNWRSSNITKSDFDNKITRCNIPNSNPILSWRDKSSTVNNQNQTTQKYNSSCTTPNNYVDDRPDHLKLRFKKTKPVVTTQDTNESTFQITQNKIESTNVDKSNTNIKIIKNETQIANTNTKNHEYKSIYFQIESDLSYWEIDDIQTLYKFEQLIWSLYTNQEPEENRTPAHLFDEHNSHFNNDTIQKFILEIEKCIMNDFNKLIWIMKLTHILTFVASSCRSYYQVKYLIQNTLPIFDFLVSNISSINKNIILVYVLIETQRVSNGIQSPKIDQTMTLIEGLWLGFLETGFMSSDIFINWLNSPNEFTEESKIGRKNVLFELNFFVDFINYNPEGILSYGTHSEDEDEDDIYDDY